MPQTPPRGAATEVQTGANTVSAAAFAAALPDAQQDGLFEQLGRPSPGLPETAEAGAGLIGWLEYQARRRDMSSL